MIRRISSRCGSPVAILLVSLLLEACSGDVKLVLPLSYSSWNCVENASRKRLESPRLLLSAEDMNFADRQRGMQFVEQVGEQPFLILAPQITGLSSEPLSVNMELKAVDVCAFELGGTPAALGVLKDLSFILDATLDDGQPTTRSHTGKVISADITVDSLRLSLPPEVAPRLTERIQALEALQAQSSDEAERAVLRYRIDLLESESADPSMPLSLHAASNVRVRGAMDDAAARRMIAEAPQATGASQIVLSPGTSVWTSATPGRGYYTRIAPFASIYLQLQPAPAEEVVLEEPTVHVMDRAVDQDDMLAVLKFLAVQESAPRLLVVPRISMEAHTLLLTNGRRGLLFVMPVETDRLGSRGSQVLQELAAVSGATVATTVEHLDELGSKGAGYFVRVRLSKDKLLVIDTGEKRRRWSPKEFGWTPDSTPEEFPDGFEPLRLADSKARFARLPREFAVIEVGGETRDQRDRNMAVLSRHLPPLD